MQNAIVSSIVLHSLELDVNLGWPDAERSQKQKVVIEMKLQFPEPPLACITDNLDDTFCYDELVTLLKNKIAAKDFRLLEHLGREVYNTLKVSIKGDMLIAVRITKKPAILNLTGGVSFYYGDMEW